MIRVRLDSGKSSRFVALGDVSVIDAQQNYSRVHLSDATHTLVRRSLKQWEDTLLDSFVRVHRGTMVNLERVIGCERTPRALSLTMAGLHEPVSVSLLARSKVKARLQSRVPEI